MNILMVHPHDIYSLKEPWTVRIRKIALEFVKNGHRVKLVFFPLNALCAYRSHQEDGIEVISLCRRVGPAAFIRNLRSMLKLAQWCDIIHFQKCYYHVSLPAIIAARVKDKPVHYDWDDWETKIFYYSNPRQYLVGGFIDIFEKAVPGLVDTVSVASDSLRRLCLSRGVAQEDIIPAPVGADIDQFKPDASAKGIIKKRYGIDLPLVTYIGQLHGGQYAELFIKAAGMIVKRRQDVRFMVVGDGYRMAELKAYASELNIEASIIFTGAVAYKEVPLYLEDADVCVACFEDNDITRCKSPLKIVEYMAMGKAVVASNVGEVRRMLGGVGLLVEPGDASAIAAGILRLLDDPDLRNRLGRSARKRTETKYNWAATAMALVEAYKKPK